LRQKEAVTNKLRKVAPQSDYKIRKTFSQINK